MNGWAGAFGDLAVQGSFLCAISRGMASMSASATQCLGMHRNEPSASLADHMIRVLIVGQGPPATGGIPSFVSDVLDDPWLRAKVRLGYLNTASHQRGRPGAATVGNARLALAHARQTFERARHADVVHLNVAPAPTLPLLRAMLLCAAARAAGARTILHAHSGRLDRCARSMVYRALLRAVLALTHAFVVVSSPAERTVSRLGAGKVVRIPNGIDPHSFLAGPKAADPPVLAFVGTVCERKGLLDLRDALVVLQRERGFEPDDLRVIVVGDSTQEGAGVDSGIRMSYELAGLGGWVEFVGAVEREEVRGILAETSILCLPSYWEGFPLSVLEGMASGAAVIATRVGDIPEMTKGAAILVDPGDVRALAEAIQRLVKAPKERDRLGAEGRRRAERDFSRARLMLNLYSLYLRVSLSPVSS
jgi:glycosyltransferase involved in cell wall biosynthesis